MIMKNVPFFLSGIAGGFTAIVVKQETVFDITGNSLVRISLQISVDSTFIDYRSLLKIDEELLVANVAGHVSLGGIVKVCLL